LVFSSLIWVLLVSDSFLEPPPDIAVPLGAPMVARTEQSLFLLDYTEALIYQYDSSGEKVRVFGGRGQGPGLFTRPYRLTWFDGRLIVHDLHSVQFFDGAGTFQEMKRVPHGTMPRKVVGGWVCLKGFIYEDNLELVSYDEDFRDVVPLFSWDVPASPGPTRTNLVQDVDALLVSSDGMWVFVKPRYSGTIWRFDSRGGEPILLDPRLQPVPFDPEDGSIRRDRVNRARKRSGLASNDLPFPETYPPIYSMTLTHHGNLAIQRWYHFPSSHISARKRVEEGALIYLDMNGSAISPTPTELAPILVIAEDEDWVYHLAYEVEKERTTIQRVPIPDAEPSLARAMRNQVCVSCDR